MNVVNYFNIKEWSVMATYMLLECPQINIKVKIRLLDDQAPKLCEEVRRVLPLTTLAWHAVISGDNAGFFLPIVWTGFDNPQERNQGDVFLYANGQLVVICYGKNTEPGRVNKFGEVCEDSLENMEKLGLAIRHGIMTGEEPFFVKLTLER